MADADFRVAVEAAEGGTKIELVGELDVATAPELRRSVDQITGGGGGGGDVWIDCSGLTFADSSGLEVLTLLAKTLRAQDRRLVLTNLRPMVRRAMDVLQITELFELHEAP
jgi:stage II sporulation protein AA (anti-sigma F factor antagonist)